ncbi:MAG: hypothetical protein OEM62_02740 [Acidobacteriota bacterium]|nr:hypothetical protein [Acidobacteriota bacterium]
MQWDRGHLAAFAPLLALHVALLLTYDLAGHLIVTLVVVALASLFLWLAVTRLQRVSLATATVLGGALILRLVLLPVPPTLSDDILRYVWDGKVAGAGYNPYRLSPASPDVEGLRDDAWERLPHKDVPTVYPPLALALFVFAAQGPFSLLSLKVLLAVADLTTCGLLLGLADRHGLHRSRVLLYAWNPLVVIEVAGMGHVDAIGVLASVATVSILAAGRGGRPRAAAVAACAASAAVLAKLIPLLAWPVWARKSSSFAVFLGTATALVVVCGVPVIVATGGVPPGYIRFGVSWEFNGPLFEPLWRLLDVLHVSPLVERGLNAAKVMTGAHDFWNRFYPLNYPQLIAKALLAACSVPFFLRAWKQESLCRATGAVFAVLIFFSSTVYPWYLLWILPWAALERSRPWLLLSALVPLSYVPQFADIDLFPGLFCAIWVPFGSALWLERR